VLLLNALAFVLINALVDPGRPVLGVLPVTRMEGEVVGLIRGGELLELGRDVGGEVGGDGDDEERRIGEDPSAALDRSGGNTAVTFGGDGADGVVGVGWAAVSVRVSRNGLRDIYVRGARGIGLAVTISSATHLRSAHHLSLLT
jgi:hypothetical protein